MLLMIARNADVREAHCAESSCQRVLARVDVSTITQQLAGLPQLQMWYTADEANLHHYFLVAAFHRLARTDGRRLEV